MDNEKINQVNNLIKSANSLSAGKNFIKMLESQRLEKAYADAEINAVQAPLKLKESEKNYFVYTKGEGYYRNMMRERYKQTAQKDKRELLDNHKEKIERLNNLLQEYDDQKLYNKRINDLFNKYETEKDHIDKEKDFYVKTKNTSDRKTYYENQQIETLKKWNKVFFVLYWILFCILAVVLLFIKGMFRDVKTWILLFILIGYPFAASYVLKFIRSITSFLMGFFPKNVYKTL